MILVVEDRVGGFDPCGRIPGRLASVEIAVEAREVAAREFKAHPVARAEDIARSPQVDRKWVRLPTHKGGGLGLRVSIATTEDALREIDGGSVR